MCTLSYTILETDGQPPWVSVSSSVKWEDWIRWSLRFSSSLGLGSYDPIEVLSILLHVIIAEKTESQTSYYKAST